MARRAEGAAARFQRLKLKLGGRDGLDIDRVRAVRGATGLPLQVDVNEAWSLDEALEALPQLAEPVSPTANKRLPPATKAARRSRSASSPIPIYVDEDCHRLGDVAACAEIAHGINIVAVGWHPRSGANGPRRRALGLGVMLGCMVESGWGSPPAASSLRPRPRRSRRQPPPSREDPGPVWSSSTECRCPPTGPASVSERL